MVRATPSRRAWQGAKPTRQLQLAEAARRQEEDEEWAKHGEGAEMRRVRREQARQERERRAAERKHDLALQAMMDKEEALHAQLQAARRHRAGKVSMATRAMGRYGAEEGQVRKRRLWATQSDGAGLAAGAGATVVGNVGECEWRNGMRVTLGRYDAFSGGWLTHTEAGEELFARPTYLLADEDEAWEGLAAWRMRRGEADATAAASAVDGAHGRESGESEGESEAGSDGESEAHTESECDSEAEMDVARDLRGRRQRQVQRKARTLVRWTHQAWNAAMRCAHGNG